MMSECVEEPGIPYGEDFSQAEADRLIGIEKVRATDEIFVYPSAGKKLEIPLTSTDCRDEFILSVVPGKIEIITTRNQLRTKNNTVLLRLDTGTKPHKNPDGQVLQCPHMHVFKEGYGIRYAWPLDTAVFTNCDDPFQTLQNFMTYCNIQKKTHLTKGADQW
ncbi:MAG: hypothetical protein Q4Q04_00580 [Methanocorpusculum sp.]|nr:hypothetical protein [Methanocorpusculum sp.]